MENYAKLGHAYARIKAYLVIFSLSFIISCASPSLHTTVSKSEEKRRPIAFNDQVISNSPNEGGPVITTHQTTNRPPKIKSTSYKTRNKKREELENQKQIIFQKIKKKEADLERKRKEYDAKLTKLEREINRYSHLRKKLKEQSGKYMPREEYDQCPDNQYCKDQEPRKKIAPQINKKFRSSLRDLDFNKIAPKGNPNTNKSQNPVGAPPLPLKKPKEQLKSEREALENQKQIILQQMHQKKRGWDRERKIYEARIKIYEARISKLEKDIKSIEAKVQLKSEKEKLLKKGAIDNGYGGPGRKSLFENLPMGNFKLFNKYVVRDKTNGLLWTKQNFYQEENRFPDGSAECQVWADQMNLEKHGKIKNWKIPKYQELSLLRNLFQNVIPGKSENFRYWFNDTKNKKMGIFTFNLGNNPKPDSSIRKVNCRLVSKR